MKKEKDFVFALQEILSNYKFQETFLDSSDVCQFLGISKSTLYKMNLRKEIPFFKPKNGKKVYYRKEDVVNYLTGIRFSSKTELDERAKTLLNN